MRNGKNTCRRIVGIVLLVAVAGCRVEGPTSEERVAIDTTVVEKGEVMTVDPLGLPQDTVPISHQLGRTGVPGDTRLVPPSRLFTGGDQLSDSLGPQVFRVQLSTIDTYSEARRALAVAQEIFDFAVTLDYEVPYYKLRVGEFATRREAEQYQQRARGAGYPNAWVMVAVASARQIQPLYQGADSASADTISR